MDWKKVAIEDLQTACEAMLVMLGFDDIERSKVCLKVIEKNRKRGYYYEKNRLTLVKTFQKLFRQNKRLGLEFLYHDKKRLWQFFRIAIDSVVKTLVNFCKNATKFLQTYMEGKNDSKGILIPSNQNIQINSN